MKSPKFGRRFIPEARLFKHFLVDDPDEEDMISIEARVNEKDTVHAICTTV